MSKLQKFNQILFAIMGSAIAIFAAVSLIVIALDFYKEWTRPDHTPLPDHKVIELVKNNKFTQTISYERGFWAWTDRIPQEDGSKKTVTSPYYIIPVSQTTLQNEQKRENINLRSIKIGVADAYYGRSGGKYNNILIYNTANNSVKKLFDHRLLVRHINIHKYHDAHFALLQTFRLSEIKDSKKDTLDDYYIYSFTDETLTKLTMPELNNISFITDQNLPYFLIRGRIDFDGNGKFDRYDPYRLFLWNYESHDISPFPGDAITEDLQKILEGRNLTPPKSFR
ncbi:MAG: hypothetical protein L3J58_03660 [Emcibacter sp.]|nr:hypothetical protein [Emcibacter sp.]